MEEGLQGLLMGAVLDVSDRNGVSLAGGGQQ